MQFEWEVLEYEYREKNPNWFWVIGSAGVVLILASILTKNLLLAILVLVATFTLMLHGHRRPEKITIVLSRHGVQIRHLLYPFKNLHSFWLHDNQPAKKITLRSEKAFMQHLHLPLPDDLDHEEIRGFLLEHLPEEHHEPTLIDALVEYI